MAMNGEGKRGKELEYLVPKEWLIEEAMEVVQMRECESWN